MIVYERRKVAVKRGMVTGTSQRADTHSDNLLGGHVCLFVWWWWGWGAEAR